MKNRSERGPDGVAEVGEDELILHYYGESAATVRTLQCVAPSFGLVCSVFWIN